MTLVSFLSAPVCVCLFAMCIYQLYLIVLSNMYAELCVCSNYVASESLPLKEKAKR